MGGDVYMRKVGFVEITGSDTAARCTKCGKSLTYKPLMKSAMWTKILNAFVRKHKECK